LNVKAFYVDLNENQLQIVLITTFNSEKMMWVWTSNNNEIWSKNQQQNTGKLERRQSRSKTPARRNSIGGDTPRGRRERQNRELQSRTMVKE